MYDPSLPEPETVRRSDGVLVGVLGDRVVACDTAGHQAHIVDGLLAWLLLLDGTTPFSDLVADVNATTGAAPAIARKDLRQAVALGTSLHLLGRSAAAPRRARPFETSPTSLSEVVGLLGQVAGRSQPVVAVTGGAVRSPGGDVWLLPGSGGLADRTLIGALIQAGCDYLGSDAIVLRDGATGVVGHPMSLRLDASCRRLLGLDPVGSPLTLVTELRGSAQLLHGDHGPIDRVLFCESAPSHPASAVRLDPVDAVQSLLACALNLADGPPSSVQSLCDLAGGPPNLRITYHDPGALAQVLVANEHWEPLADLDRRIRHQRRLHPLPAHSPGIAIRDDLEVRRAPSVACHDAIIGGEPTTFLISRTGRTAWALGGLPRRIWAGAARGASPLIELIRSEADLVGGSDEHASQMVARTLASMAGQGLVVDDGAGVRSSHDAAADGSSPAGAALTLRRFGESRWQTTPDDAREAWSGLSWEGNAIEWLGHRLVVDMESIQRTLINMRGARSVGVGAPDEVSGALVEVRSAPGAEGMMLIRLNGRRLWWASEEDGLAVLGIILANLANDSASIGQSLGDISIIRRRDRCLLHVGDLTSHDAAVSEATLVHRARVFGARIEHGRTVLLPEEARAVSWLVDGADPAAAMDVWNPCALAGVLVEGARDLVGGWLKTFTELGPWRPADSRFLSELVADGDVPLTVVRQGEAASEIAEALLVQDDKWEEPSPSRRSSPSRPTTVRSERGTDDGSSANSALQSGAWNWGMRLGEVSWSQESAKLSRDRLVVGRGLLRIRLANGAEAEVPQPAAMVVDSVTAAIADLGVDADTAGEIAQTSVAAGNLYIGVELTDNGVRRKLYVRDITAPVWAEVSRHWPRTMVEGGAMPSWLAWKWTDAGPGKPERSIYQHNLGDALSFGQRVDPILDLMGPDWIEVISHLLARLGIERNASPAEDDLFTLDEDGRRSVDLSGVSTGRRWRDIEAEVRWLAAVADLSKDASDDLLAWSRGGRMARLIFGIDRDTQPFVNLYVARERQRVARVQ